MKNKKNIFLILSTIFLVLISYFFYKENIWFSIFGIAEQILILGLFFFSIFGILNYLFKLNKKYFDPIYVIFLVIFLGLFSYHFGQYYIEKNIVEPKFKEFADLHNYSYIDSNKFWKGSGIITGLLENGKKIEISLIKTGTNPINRKPYYKIQLFIKGSAINLEDNYREKEFEFVINKYKDDFYIQTSLNSDSISIVKLNKMYNLAVDLDKNN